MNIWSPIRYLVKHFQPFAKPLMYQKKIINYIISILNSLLVVGVYNCSTITSCLLILHLVDSQFSDNDDHFLKILPCLFPLLDLVDYVVRHFAIFSHAQHIVPLVRDIVSILRYCNCHAQHIVPLVGDIVSI